MKCNAPFYMLSLSLINHPPHLITQLTRFGEGKEAET
jgi:hypothetical protein